MRKGFGGRDRVVFGLSQWAGSTAPFFSATRWPTIAAPRCGGLAHHCGAVRRRLVRCLRRAAAVGAAFLDSAGEAWRLTDPALMQLY